MMAVGLLLAGLAPFTLAQRNYERARHLVGRTDGDLRRISHRAANPKEQERYDNALRHLSQFDQSLAQGGYDKGKLDASIDDINNICKNNTLSPRERDVLLGDLGALRNLRAEWH